MNNPTETASPSYHTSTQNTKLAVEAIKGCGKFSSACHQLYAIIRKARHRTQKTLEEVGKKKLVVTLSPARQRANQEGKTSSWLMTLPLQICYFDLDPEMALLCAICYTSLICQPNVMVVGLISLRSNVPLISLSVAQIIKEPIVNESTVTSSDPGLRLDLGIRCVWQPQVEALVDVCVVDTDAPTHCHRAPNAILESSSQEDVAVEDRRDTFTPIVLSADGLDKAPYSIIQQLCQITACFCQGSSSEPLSERVLHKMEKCAGI
ncbi:hypothetical protein EMCRGX_G016606 [Ephydatia muelleri]